MGKIVSGVILVHGVLAPPVQAAQAVVINGARDIVCRLRNVKVAFPFVQLRPRVGVLCSMSQDISTLPFRVRPKQHTCRLWRRFWTSFSGSAGGMSRNASLQQENMAETSLSHNAGSHYISPFVAGGKILRFVYFLSFSPFLIFLILFYFIYFWGEEE